MCGIAGMIGRRASEATVRTMTDRIAHRGPDGEGVFAVPGVVLGHRRLSIIDLSDAGSQPMRSADDRYTIVFNGEIYNYKELRAELAGYPFHSQTDTEVILAAWERWGQKALDRFLGMFAFAIHDAHDGSVTLVRDRLGIKPLYYAEWEGNILFASEIKAILAAGYPAREHAPAIAQYLIWGYYDHGPETFFSGIRAVPQGGIMTIGPSGSAVRRWWVLPERVQAVTGLADAENVDAFLALFADSMRMHLRSDVPIGLTLSSGVDSMSMFYQLRRSAALPQLQAFSMGFAEPEMDETVDIAAAAAREGLPMHRVEIVPADFQAYLEKTVDALDQPFG
ncbi:MAG: asparagine synthase (glutamine-hydrolyzing), partial [Patescibacteria group bacterium]